MSTVEGRYQVTQARALWFCRDCGAVVPIEARHIHDRSHDPAGPDTGVASPLAELQQRYLEVRQHRLSTAGLPIADAVAAQVDYFLREARELESAANDLGAPGFVTDIEGRPFTTGELLTAVRHEIADVVLAATTLANLLGVTVEACIEEKTEHDRGRG